MTGQRFTAAHASFLAKRGIFEAALETGVQSGTGLGAGDVIKIPYGNGWFKTYRVEEKNPWQQIKPKNSRLPLWRLESIDFGQPWVITEGEWDAMAAYQVGWHNVTSIPDGAVQPAEENPAKSGKLVSVRDAWDRISSGNGQAILALDNDECGDVTKSVLIDIIGRWRCCTIEYPEHPKGTGLRGRCKDLNEVLQLLGESVLRHTLASARPLDLEGVFKPSEIARRQPRQYFDIGIEGMENHLRFFRGELCVMTGITGHGKSTLLFNILGNLVKHNLQIGLGTFEADFWEDIYPWYENWLYANPKAPEIVDPRSGEILSSWRTDQTAKDTEAWMEENFTIISHQVRPLAKQASIEWFIQQAADAKGRHGIDVLVLDPWNKMQHKRGPGENEPDYIGRALSDLRNFAQVTNTIVIVTAHPTKDTFKADGSIEMPNVSQIHGAMNWGNMADHVVVVFRPTAEKNQVCLSVQKSRFKKGGVRGHCWYVFNSETNQYRMLEKHLWPTE
jgi:twinkle protein